MNSSGAAHRMSRRRRSVALTAGFVAASTALATAAAAPAGALSVSSHPHIYRTQLSSSQIKKYSKDATKRVIVLLRNQYSGELSGGNHTLAVRSESLHASQQSVVSELRSLHAPNLKQFSFINAVSATVSPGEAARLATNPAVASVVPDGTVSPAPGATVTPDKSAAKADDTTPSDRVNSTAGICGTAKNPLLQPEALTHIAATTPHHGITGKGVKIAVFPDGLDPNIRDFIRPDGSHAIFDYRDFSGDGPKGVTTAGEAFGDASSLIAQGRQTFDLSKYVNPQLPLPTPCDIRIKGVSPGASLAVMKIFGLGDSFDSTVLQALDWAVSHDHVNVLSESFGENVIPQTGQDLVSLFDSEAVAHGISVVASAGDAGVTDTIGGPAAASTGIISAAASTDYQSNAQLSEHGYQLGGFKGWESNNISAFSSSGDTEYGPNSVDVIAPGDSGWADCSSNTDVYLECADDLGGTNPPPIEDFGGTSQACPLTAGVVALVIQAYRSTHGGATPTPALVKRIITSTATNLGEPANEQGHGQVEAHRAVDLARTYGAKKPSGGGLVVHRQKVETTGAPSSAHTATITVSNENSTSTTVAPTLKEFGPATTLASQNLNYDPTSSATPSYIYWLGGPEPYVEQPVTVPAGYQRLVARIGYPSDPTDASQTVSEVLFDPQGKVAADSEPQGAPLGFSQVEVHNPKPGVWHAIYFSRPGSDKYSGRINTSFTVQKLVSVAGAVSPASARIASRSSKTFTVHYATPAAAGDASAAVSFGAKVGEVPVLTRSLVEPSVTAPGPFSAELTDGNGRMGLGGQELPFQFNVPQGVKDIDVDARIADPGYQLIGVLVDPLGSPVDQQDSSFTDLTTTNSDGSSPSTNDQTLHLSLQAPMAGRWNLDFETVGGSSSGKTASTLTGTVAFNTVKTVAVGVPNDAKTMLMPDTPTTASVTVTNTGNSPEIYYVDPREDNSSTYSLGFYNSPNGTLPITPTADGISGSLALLPPESTSLTIVANANVPVALSPQGPLGAPEFGSAINGTTAVAGYDVPDEAAGTYTCAPTQIGPFSSAASGGTYSCGAFAQTATINDDVTATGGNLWDSATDEASPNTFDPGDAKVVQPGQSTTLTVAIEPTEDEEGETVSGYLSVQNFDPFTVASDDLVHIPYTYTVATPPAPPAAKR